jgi:hypothetical protein
MDRDVDVDVDRCYKVVVRKRRVRAQLRCEGGGELNWRTRRLPGAGEGASTSLIGVALD